MIFVGALPAFEENFANLPALRAPTPHLVHAVTSNSAPWLYTALSQIENREGTGELLVGVGDLRVNHAAADAARTAILAIASRDLPTPAICAVSGGGLGITWGVGDRRLEFTVYPDQEVTYTTIRGQNIQRAGDVISVDEQGAMRLDDPRDLGQQLRWLMGE
jgi:hypothetical protein